MAYQGVNPLFAIQLALSGELYARAGGVSSYQAIS